MFKRKTMIHLKDTDATGVLYFSEQFKFALETFEEYLLASGLSLQTLIDSSDFLIPIVHAEADYSFPLMVGDEIEITLTLARLGKTSFTLGYRIFNLTKQSDAGSASIVHVSMSKKTRQSIPLPEKLLHVLEGLQQELPALSEKS